MPRVSALVPTYNRADYVGGAIETVLGQTYSDIEAVVVDDGSTDGTERVLAQYADHDRVRAFRNDANRGIAYSFNRAAANARGEYLCILGDDDRWHPRKVEKQVSLMDDLGDDYAVVYTGGVTTLGEDIVSVERPSRRGDIYPEILASFGLAPHSSHMIRRSHFESVGGFDTDFPRGVDWELCIRLAEEYRFEYVPEPLVEWRLHGDNVTSDPDKPVVGDLVAEKYAEELRRHPEVERELRALRHEDKAERAIEHGEHRACLRHYLLLLRYQQELIHVAFVLLALFGPRAFGVAEKLKRRVEGPVRRHVTTPRRRRDLLLDAQFDREHGWLHIDGSS